MYALLAYGRMTADRRRWSAYEQALARVVTPVSSVLDVGCGAGLLALMAARHGARHVYAIERSPVIELAREIAAANGAAAIEFIAGSSRAVDLPERVDIIVSDLHGVLPLCEDSVTSIVDARDRFLRPGGVLIPCADDILAGVVTAPVTYAAAVGVWDAVPPGFDLSPARSAAAQTIARMADGDGALLTEPAEWVAIDYRRVQTASFQRTLRWTVSTPGLAHGLMLWFESTLADGIVLSSAPGQPPLVYGRALLPWPEAVALTEGDRVEIDLRADSVDDDYVWTWKTAIERRQRRLPRFSQSTFTGAFIDRSRLQ
jgi:Methyltransferase domain/Arginine methyltransferase oligomerization subdomain